MHASIEQLLKLRDARIEDGHAGDPGLEAHVESCAACRAELARLRGLRETLRALPEIEPPDGRWQDIVRAASGSRSSWLQPLAWGIAASLLVMVWLAGNLSGRDSIDSRAAAQPGDAAPAAIGDAAPADDMDALIARSRRLGWVLQSLPGRPEVVRAGTDSTIASLENTLALVDFTLNQPDTALTSDEARELWEYKVNLMDSLVKVRYTEASFASL